MIKVKKRTKYSRAHGKGMGTAGWGARKKHKKSGHRGGTGFAGTGKRGDQKKTLILKQYGHSYFGKKGKTSLGSRRDKRDSINVSDIEVNIESLIQKGIAKKVGTVYEVNLKGYKILGSGTVTLPLKIQAKEASTSAIEKVNQAKGEILLQKSEEKGTKTKVAEEKPQKEKKVTPKKTSQKKK